MAEWSKKEQHRIRQSIARKNWLKNTDPEILNKIYKKMAETKRLKYKQGLLVPWNKGIKRPPFSEEWKKNLSNSLKNHKSSKNVIEKIILRNKTRNPMWDPKTVKKAVEKRNYKEIARKTTLTKIKRGTFLEYSKRMRENNPMKDPRVNAKVNKNPENIKRRINALIKKPNKKERILINLINKNNLPYKYVGDGKLIIGSKNPDFVHKARNKIIELFGDYWHTKKARCYEETENGRKDYFKKYHFETLIIWENELKNLNLVLEKIKLFEGTNTFIY
jgi:very-short-patch-repair endonuclease